MTLDQLFGLLQDDLGLVLFTVLGVALMVYLAYSMAHAERE
jgi:hypothetical protein